MSLIDTSQWWLVANVHENWLERVKPGDKVLYSLRNYPSSVRTGTVATVGLGVLPGQGYPNADLADTHERLARRNDAPQETQRFQILVKLQDDQAGEPLRVGATGRAVVFASGGLAGLNQLMVIAMYILSFFDYFFPKPSPLLLLAMVAIAIYLHHRKQKRNPGVSNS
jgi:hypothetical protein